MKIPPYNCPWVDDWERLKKEIIQIIASEPVSGLGIYSRIAEKILKDVFYPHLEEIKAGYDEELMRARRDSKTH